MKDLRIALRLFVVLTVLTGILYPIAITIVGQVAFSNQANGNLVSNQGTIVGSDLIGQEFEDPGYFWGRPSATSDSPYNASLSSGSNLGPTSPGLEKVIRDRIHDLKQADPTQNALIPTDLVTASASGLDPDISIDAAMYQASRVAERRGVDRSKIEHLIQDNIIPAQFGFLGEPRIRVLRINQQLDHLYPTIKKG